MNDKYRQLAEVSKDQHGALTAGQIGAAGLSAAELRRGVRSGALDRIGAHTYRSTFAIASEIADLAALLLDCGGEAFVSGPSAAALHGFDGFRLRRPFHVTVLRGRNIQRAHHHIHTTTHLPQIDRATVSGLRALSATRTLIDLARFVGPAELTRALGSALRDGLTAEAFLHRRIVELRSKGRYGIPRLLAVIEGVEVTRGGHSWLERRFLELCADAGLPAPSTGPESRPQAAGTRRLPVRGHQSGRRTARVPLAPHEAPDGPRRRTAERDGVGRLRAPAVHVRPGHRRPRLGHRAAAPGTAPVT